MASSSFTKKVTTALYRRIPTNFRDKIETIVSPLTFRLLTRKIININPKLGTPPYKPLSIVVPSYDDYRYLKVLLKSLDRTLSQFEYEVIISDDFCDESNSALLRTLETENVKLVFSHERTGFAGAVNRGIKEAQWDVVLLNSDIKALPYWAENLQAAAYNIDSQIGLVSPHLLYPSGRIQYGGTFHAATIAPQWFAHLDQGRLANDSRANVGKYVKAISGACVYIKKEVLDQLGGLDSKYWLGFEDVDFAFNASAHGFRSYVEPSSKLVHLESASRGKIQGFKEYESMRRFWDKWAVGSSEFSPRTEIAFFLSTSSSPLLMAVATSIVHELSTHGLKASLHQIDASKRVDESIISEFEQKKSYKIALDIDSVETVWLAGQNSGSPVIYFPSLDLSGADINNPEHLALFKPEFTIFFGNEVDSHNISLLIPWMVERDVFPPPVNYGKKNQVQKNFLGKSQVTVVSESDRNVDEILKLLSNSTFEYKLIHEQELVTRIKNQDFYENEVFLFENPFSASVFPVSLLANEALFVSVFSPATKQKVLDGFNTLSYEKDDWERSFFLVNGLLSDKNSRDSLRANGYYSAQQIRKTFATAFIRSLTGQESNILPKISNL